MAAVGLAALLPTIALAGVPAYFQLVAGSARISPTSSSIPRSTFTVNSDQPYKLFATFIDPGNPGNPPFELDVTLCNQAGSQTVFTIQTAPGNMVGPNSSVFRASRTSGSGTVTGTYTGNGGSTFAVATQVVQ